MYINDIIIIVSTSNTTLFSAMAVTSIMYKVYILTTLIVSFWISTPGVMGDSDKVSDNICCVPDQFEAFFFYDNGNCFIDMESPDTAYSYINGSVRAAYDWVNKRSYLSMTGVELTPLVPGPQVDDVTIINDFAHGVQYSFHGNRCDKSQVDTMTRQCLPGDATQVSSGVIGNNETHVSTYTYTVPSSPYTFTTTLQKPPSSPASCMAVHMTYVVGSAEPDSGTLNSLIVSDVTSGIKDAGIFTPPKSCFSSSPLLSTQSEELAENGGVYKMAAVAKTGESRSSRPRSSGILRVAKRLSLSLPFFRN